MESGSQAGERRSCPFFSAALILLIAILCGGAANLVSPRRIPWVEDWANYIEAKALKEGVRLVRTEQARRIVDAGMHVVLDARPAADYAAGHLPGATSLPYNTVEESLADVQSMLAQSTPILTYCAGENCDESFLLTLFLRQQGFTNSVLFLGGFDQWKAAGYPVEGAP
ncbi:MAG: rhodanese-like domain-containing protein [Verrucomicrobiota bacterium]